MMKCCKICNYFKMHNALDPWFSGVFTGLNMSVASQWTEGDADGL